jgi:hypothetical protein
MSATIFIDSSVLLAEHIARKIRAVVGNGRAAEQRALKRGDAECADRCKRQWVAFDEMGGMVSSWSLAFLAGHRANVLRALIENWPRPPADFAEESADDCEAFQEAES